MNQIQHIITTKNRGCRNCGLLQFLFNSLPFYKPIHCLSIKKQSLLLQSASLFTSARNFKMNDKIQSSNSINQLTNSRQSQQKSSPRSNKKQSIQIHETITLPTILHQSTSVSHKFHNKNQKLISIYKHFHVAK